MTYREELTAAMDMLAADARTRFVGYGLARGRAMGTMKNVSASQIVETPVAENLMTGLAVGMALTGLRPVVFFERMDFVLNAADAIVNHLNAAKIISRGEYNPTCILRVVVGNRTKPLFTGHTHTQDFTSAFRHMLDFPVIRLESPEQIAPAYKAAFEGLANYSTMLVELKDLI